MMDYCKLLCILLLTVISGPFSGFAEKQKKVVYRDYTRRGEVLLDSLKKDGRLASFKGMHAMKREVAGVKANTPVHVECRKAGKKRLDPGKIIEQRRASVLTVNKFLRATTQPECVTEWATAVVLSEDGICVSNYHVFWELLDSTARLNARDSVMFVATEGGVVYPITEILSYSRTGDFAFFRIDTRGDALTPMPLGDDLPVGADVYLLSNPEGYLYTYTCGVVSRTITLDPNDPFANRMEMTANFAKGSSGGPIMDKRGNMVAMVSCIRAIYYSMQPPYYLQMNVKQTIPVSSFKRLFRN